ncbi:MAG: SMP-30/gluconolactonase/LRE family protein [Bauldia sp.]|uniref:SMP-30/gluconolactonase/LRE family protein n=1 Tax=Bauldia sp. TaxID=2575872 RepID=UPI001D297FD1|nr:SMP-30/gluconolactonase/LRE family protein [Bauldia sp.]MCB1496709.1 SMP-30/gluconolactonase/LRE family protein [Bauldia sp.]
MLNSRRLAAFGPLLALVLAAASAGAATSGLTTINPKSAYPEGPSYRDGILYYTEMGSDRVMTWDGRENRVLWSRRGCYPTTVAQWRDSEMIVLCHRQELLARIDRSGGTLGLIEADDTGRGFPTPNAATPDGEGGLYFSSSGMFSPQAPATGAVLYLDAKGGLRRVADGIHYSNGVALSPDGRTLFVSEHLSRNVLAFDVAADGGLSGRRIFLHLDDIVGADPDRGWEVGPDGLAVDREGNLFIAEYGGGRILVVDRAGSLRATIRVPEAYVTSMVLVPDESRLFITAPATIFATGGAVYSAANPLRQPD